MSDQATAILEANRYMTLGTAGEDGRPWVSPVYYALDGAALLWVSSPDARHSRNIAVRPEVCAVVFDSTVPIGGAEAVYMTAVAEELTDVDGAVEAFSRRSLEHGARAWGPADVLPPATPRLYRAAIEEQWILDASVGGDRRHPVEIHRSTD